jgi:hypothetical protein
MTKAIFSMAAVAAMGCATMRHDSEATQAKSLEPGVSTLDDARRLFGEPTYTSTQAGGNLLCVWSDSDGQMKANSKAVTLAFGPDGRLLEAPYSFPGAAPEQPVPAAPASAPK